jgi:hypothetical protein
VGKPEEERLLTRPRHRWMDNIKMDLRWTDLNQDRDECRAFV